MQVLVDAPVWLDDFAGVRTKETDLLDRLLVLSTALKGPCQPSCNIRTR